jgi:hypothetical protein
MLIVILEFHTVHHLIQRIVSDSSCAESSTFVAGMSDSQASGFCRAQREGTCARQNLGHTGRRSTRVLCAANGTLAERGIGGDMAPLGVEEASTKGTRRLRL